MLDKITVGGTTYRVGDLVRVKTIRMDSYIWAINRKGRITEIHDNGVIQGSWKGNFVIVPNKDNFELVKQV